MNFRKKFLPLALTIIIGVGTLGIANAALLPNGLTSQSAYSIDVSQYNISQEDFVLLAKIISAEAQGESYSTQVAVGAVVLNRVASSQFPNTIRDVIYDISNGIYQFTPVQNGFINKPPTASAIQAAQDALKGVDPTNGALFFFETAVTTNKFLKALPVATQMGAFTFSYSEKGTKGITGSSAVVAKPSNINTAAGSSAAVAKPSNINTAVSSAVSNKSVKPNNNYKAQSKQAPSYSAKKIQNVAQKQSPGYNGAGHDNKYPMKGAQGSYAANKVNVNNGSWGNNNWNNENCDR